MSKDKWPDKVTVSVSRFAAWFFAFVIGLAFIVFEPSEVSIGKVVFSAVLAAIGGWIANMICLQRYGKESITASRGSLLWIVVVVLPWATLGCARYVIEIACKAVLWACTATPAMGRGKKADPQARGMSEAIQAALKARTRKEANDILRKAVSKGN